MQDTNRDESRVLFVAPAARVLIEHERQTERAGHENEGFLSASHGFVPRAAPLARLSQPFRAWDELAAELPALHRSLELRRSVEQLPVLDASEGALDASEALRACALLAVVAHAYWYVEPTPPTALPAAVSLPWAQLRARLGRDQEVLSYIDLVVYNWRLRDAARAGPMVVENLELLLPTVGNDEERVFYMTQLEILAQASPVPRLVAAAQNGVLHCDDDAIESALSSLIDVLRAIVRSSLPKIDPRPSGATYMNPVVWAKTVAPFAVPIRAGLQGPSGTSSPLFNTLDLFFGRKQYDSFLGREIKQLRATYPRGWRSFLRAVAEVSLADHVQRTGRRSLQAAFREALELYAGDDGFLGRHRMKVYGFLELAFKVGRSVTIGGFSGVFRDRTWNVVDDALRASRTERSERDEAGARPAVGTTIQAAAPSSRVYAYSEVAQHNEEQHGYWLVIDGVVYDVGELIRVHPGGRRILQLYAGMDATQGFARAHAHRANVHAMRARYRIGVLRELVLDEDISCTQRAFVHALQLVVEMQNALAAEQSLQTEPIARNDAPAAPTPYKLARALETHQRFWNDYAGLLCSETLPALWRIAQASLFPDEPSAYLADALALSRSAQPARAAESLTAEDARALERLDRELLGAIKAELTAALHEIERHGVLVRQLGAPRIRSSFTAITSVVSDYVGRSRADTPSSSRAS